MVKINSVETNDLVYDKKTDTWSYKDDKKNEIKKNKTSDDEKVLRKNSIALQDFFTRAFDFAGVSTPREFWIPYLIVSVLIAILGVGVRSFDALNMFQDAQTLIMIRSLFLVIIALPTLSLVVRRLHDAGYNGWFLTILNIIAMIVSFDFYVVTYIISMIFLLQPSNYENNKYYEDDKNYLLEKTGHSYTNNINTNNNTRTTNNTHNINDLEKAANLYKQKLITKAEFEKIKKQCLSE